jgi:hypothetical protein
MYGVAQFYCPVFFLSPPPIAMIPAGNSLILDISLNNACWQNVRKSYSPNFRNNLVVGSN